MNILNVFKKYNNINYNECFEHIKENLHLMLFQCNNTTVTIAQYRAFKDVISESKEYVYIEKEREKGKYIIVVNIKNGNTYHIYSNISRLGGG